MSNYVWQGDLGVTWCTAHFGVCNEDEDGCDFSHHSNEPCELRELFYRRYTNDDGSPVR